MQSAGSQGHASRQATDESSDQTHRTTRLWFTTVSILVVCGLASLARAQTPTPPADSFNPEVSGGSFPFPPTVYALAVQTDARVFVGGRFTTVGGQARSNLGRVNGDGALEVGFNPAPNSNVLAIAVQGDGRIVLAGAFTMLGPESRNRIARLNPDGTLEAAFLPAGADGPDYPHCSALAIQDDARILVGGSFTTLGGQPRNNLARLHPDGTVDAEFAPNPDGVVLSLALQPDGKILVGGGFSMIKGQTRNNVARLNADGTLDAGFNPGASAVNFFSTVRVLAVQADGKILIGGSFTSVAGQSRTNLARLNIAGNLDAGFDPGPNNAPSYPSYVFSLALQADGKIVVGGTFDKIDGQPRSGTVRLSPDGTLDAGFDLGPYADSLALAVQADGKILVGGSSTILAGQPRSRLGRLAATDPAIESLTHTNGKIVWLRGGSSPEVWRTTFELSTNGSDWLPLGAGTRVTGGWHLAAVSIPSGAQVRARGHIAGGYQNASAWFVQSTLGPPVLLLQPYGRTNLAGTVATFSTIAGGSEPLSYQWQKDGTALRDGGQIAGATSPSLSISNLLHGDEGDYSVTIANRLGSMRSVMARLGVVEPVIAAQPISQSREVGQAVTFAVTVLATPPLSYQWWKGEVALVQGTNATLALADVQTSDIGQYRVVVDNAYGHATSDVAQLTVNLATLDVGFNAGANGTVYSVAPQPDGRILVGGGFTSLGGQPRFGLGRLNTDGSPDADFAPGVARRVNAFVYAQAVQEDGKIVVGGLFTSMNGQPRTNLARIFADGTLDQTFRVGADAAVRSLVIQADGKALVGGYFRTLGGQPRNGLGRLNADGTLDAGFVPPSSSIVEAVTLQTDGKILAKGFFSSPALQMRTNLARLHPDGTLDLSFDPGAPGGGSFPALFAIVAQSDGKILAGGTFTTFAGRPRSSLVRLNADGTVDEGIDLAVLGGGVASLAVQADGRILLGGAFTNVAGQARTNIARLNENGTLDLSFDPGNGGGNFPVVYSVALQADGKVLVGGEFSTLGGQARNRIGRLNHSHPASQSVGFSDSTLTWRRGGSSPEVWRTTFAYLTNGGAWTTLGAGRRVAGGWELAGVSVPPGAVISARGYVIGANYTSSSWLLESMLGPPIFLTHPASRTNDAGTVATFTTVAAGSPLSYQWRKNGVPLTDGANVTGAQTSSLKVSNVLKRDEGGYSVAVLNADGNLTSGEATLAVIDPVILGQPVSAATERGEDISFTVAAAGTALNFQWWKDGTALPKATNATLALANLQASDDGFYHVVVSNLYASVTSAAVRLTVNLLTVDPEFQAGIGRPTYALAMLPDGRILVGSQSWGGPAPMLNRLHADGSLESSFLPVSMGVLYSLAVQMDGKILVGGAFTNFSGLVCTNLLRLNADGTIDPAFNPGANRAVYCLALQADGKIVVGGEFTRLAGQPRNSLGRLKADGTLDTGFDAGVSGPVPFNEVPSVFSLALQEDGKIVLGGTFTNVAGQSRSNLARVQADGTVDSAFNPGPDGPVRALAMQADGALLVGGSFSSLGGQSRYWIARLNRDGGLDPTFNPAPNGSVQSLAVQADGRILLAGLFTSVSGQTRWTLARLTRDGTVDEQFNSEMLASETIATTTSLQDDGKILVGSGYPEALPLLVRMNNTAPAVQSVTYDGMAVTWLRGGTSPEVWRTTFDYATNAGDWIPLGDGTRIPGGWRLPSVSIGSNATIRARGQLTGGYGNGSTWFVERFLSPPLRLSIERQGSKILLQWTGGHGPYQVQRSTNLADSNAWQNVGVAGPTNSISLPVSAGHLFLRIRGQ